MPGMQEPQSGRASRDDEQDSPTGFQRELAKQQDAVSNSILDESDFSGVKGSHFVFV